MIGVTYSSIENKTLYGALNSASGLSPTQRVDIVKDSLMCDYIRTRIVIFDAPPAVTGGAGWGGSSNVYEHARSRGLKQVVVLVAYPTGTEQPFVVSSAIPMYKQIVDSILSTYPDIKLVVVDNEPQTNSYHSGPMSDYVAMVQAVREVAMPRRVKVTHGGFGNGFPIWIRVYQYVMNKYGEPTANAYALTNSVNMTPRMVDYAKGLRTPGADPDLDQGCADFDLIINTYPFIDYHNIHFYEEPNTDSDVNISPNVVRFHKEYLENVGKRRVMTNECGQHAYPTPGMVTNMMNEFKRLKFKHVQWYDGLGTNAVPLSDDITGARQPNGDAFMNFVVANK